MGKRLSQAFTLIEMLLVLILLSILSVNIIPKFFDNNGFSIYAYRADVMAKLQLIRNTAMQQTSNLPNQCHTVLVTDNKIGRPDNCDPPSFAATYTVQEQARNRRTMVQVDEEDSIVFNLSGGQTVLEAGTIVGKMFTFDNMGRPSCNGGCEIFIEADNEVLSILVEKEGFIHEN